MALTLWTVQKCLSYLGFLHTCIVRGWNHLPVQRGEDKGPERVSGGVDGRVVGVLRGGPSELQLGVQQSAAPRSADDPLNA